MKQKLKILIFGGMLLSCGGKEQPFLHKKTTSFTCDNKYFVKLLNTDIRKEHIIPSDDGRSFYTVTENGIMRYNINNIQKEWEKYIHFGDNIGNFFFVRPDKKIWIVVFDEPGYVNGPLSYSTFYLIDTTGNIYLTKKVRRGIFVDNNNGFIIARNGYDSAEWVNHSFFKSIDKYFVESYDEKGNLLWGKNYELKGGEIESLCYLSTNEILIGGYSDSYISGKAYLAKLDNKGVLKWNRTYMSNYNVQNWSVKAILEKSPQSYNLIINRSMFSFNLLEIDSAGLTKWDTELNGYFYRNDHLLYINDRYLILSSNQNDIKLTGLNKSGVVLWSHNYGGTGTELPACISVLPSNDLFITGTTQNWDGIGYTSFNSDYFIKTDMDGNTCY